MDTATNTIRQALNAQRGNWMDIARRAGVSHSWISQFVRGKIPGPKVTTLEKVHAACRGESATSQQTEGQTAHKVAA